MLFYMIENYSYEPLNFTRKLSNIFVTHTCYSKKIEPSISNFTSMNSMYE